MNVVVIPPNKPCIRKDLPSYIFTHKEAKNKAIVEEIKRINSTGQPILIGTSSVKDSSYIANQLLNIGVKCQVLNAKNDELEAHIIQNAGTLGAVTVSTNMAGRGTDILLGGIKGEHREKIKELGGLYVLGTNRHESFSYKFEKDFSKLYEKLRQEYDEIEIKRSMKNLRLFHIDQCWADYLENISNFKAGIHLQVFAAKNPLREFQMRLISDF